MISRICCQSHPILMLICMLASISASWLSHVRCSSALPASWNIRLAQVTITLYILIVENICFAMLVTVIRWLSFLTIDLPDVSNQLLVILSGANLFFRIVGRGSNYSVLMYWALCSGCIHTVLALLAVCKYFLGHLIVIL